MGPWLGSGAFRGVASLVSGLEFKHPSLGGTYGTHRIISFEASLIQTII